MDIATAGRISMERTMAVLELFCCSGIRKPVAGEGAQNRIGRDNRPEYTSHHLGKRKTNLFSAGELEIRVSPLMPKITSLLQSVLARTTIKSAFY